MSARRIRVIAARNQNPRYVQAGRQDVVSRKKEERQIRQQHKREKQIDSYLADDENFPSFSTQLGKLGLQLRDIPGDGNCLFRALGDQLEGHCRNHYKYRFEICNYMSEHREEFEPFVEDDTPFEKYIKNLSAIGTYAGNDAIVAFARLYQINVVIHQLNSPFLLIQGPKTQSQTIKQIHISYHNGDHYSSVRKHGDNTESPANIRVKIGGDSQSAAGNKPQANGVTNGDIPHCGRVVKAVRDVEIIEQEIMAATGCDDLTMIHESLYECDNDVDSAIAHILQIMTLTDESFNTETSSEVSQRTSTDSGVCTGNNSPVSSHVRDNSYGGSSGYDSIGSNGGARPKKDARVTAKERKEAKKMEKKKRAEERHRMKVGGMKTQFSHDEDVHTVITKDIAMMKI
ncbi:OTU domain-containing protein 3-like isoform X2 [Mytilus edulis]